MDNKRLRELAGLPMITENEEGNYAGGDERRAVPRNYISNALKVFTNHMHQIRRALEENKIDVAKGLVDGAIKSFGKDRGEE